MQGKKRILLMLLPALLLGSIVYVMYSQSTGTTGILAAKQTINAGMRITEDMLTTVQVPNTAIPEGALTNPENVIGKAVAVTRTAGDIIFRDILSNNQPTLKEGEAFVAIPIPDALSDMVSEGTLLTVIEHLSITDNLNQKTEPTAIEKLPVHTVVQTGDETINTNKYAIVKTESTKAKTLVNITAKEHSVIIAK